MKKANPPSSAADLPVCPSCLNPMITTPDHKCPLCGYALDAHDVISEDTTPYADRQRRSYRKMMWWVLRAGSYRLSHVARMRGSRSSSRFAWLSVIMLALACALFVAPSYTSQAWNRVVERGASYPDGYPQPSGLGWMLVGKAPRPPGLAAGEAVLVRLWWNPGLWSITLVLNFVVPLALGRFVIFWVTRRSTRALLPRYRDEKRFGAAIHYCTAHLPALLLAALCYATCLLRTLGEIYQWPVQWPLLVHTMPAFLIAGLGLFLMWFWLLRMAHTVPPETAASVSRYFGLWAPLSAIILLGGWIVGQHYAIGLLAAWLAVGF